MSYYANPHSHQCTWYPYNELFGASNVNWCEETMCHFVSEPINTYSNGIYILVALISFLFIFKKNNKDLNKLTLIVAGLGIVSAFYHMSNNYLGQVLDHLFIFLFIFWCLTLNLQKLKILSKEKRNIFYISITSIFMIILHILYLNHIYFQALIGLAALMFLYSETKIIKLQNGTQKSLFLYLSIIFIVTGSIFSFLDLTRTLCDPANHLFQGHALWHLLSGVGLGFLIYHLSLRMNSYEKTQEHYVHEFIEKDDEESSNISFSNNIINNEDDLEEIEYFDEEENEDLENLNKDFKEDNDTLELSPDEINNSNENQLELDFSTEEEEEKTLTDPIIDSYSDNEIIDDEVDEDIENEDPEKLK